MTSSSQLPLPLPSCPALSRADLIVAPANAPAIGFVDAWPDWPAKSAALHGPAGCGKTHLVSIWRERAGARSVAASEIGHFDPRPGEAVAIEDVDRAPATPARDAAVFAIFESGGWTLLTGRSPPSAWACALPDLASRFSAITTLPLREPDEALLTDLARKLFSDRQLFVPDALIEGMLRRLDRAPGAIRDFVAELDCTALAAGKPVSLHMVRSLIAARETQPP
jgi:chromosomal replication initiation ATPase DnaA